MGVSVTQSQCVTLDILGWCAAWRLAYHGMSIHLYVLSLSLKAPTRKPQCMHQSSTEMILNGILLSLVGRSGCCICQSCDRWVCKISERCATLKLHDAVRRQRQRSGSQANRSIKPCAHVSTTISAFNMIMPKVRN